MKINQATWWQSGLVACALVMASCGGAEVAEETPAEVPATGLEQAIEDRGEPCTCVTENLEAMSGLLESLKSTEKITAQELNIQIAQMMLPCMKPTGNLEADRDYSRAMGQCENFSELTGVMSEVKTEVQTRVAEEAASEQARNLDGAKGASEVLDKLRKK
jgi:hypothetical protein